jgi:sugar-specific transcriptional regulator TrmB
MSRFELQVLLEKIGLTEKEAQTYLANLETGTSVAGAIAKRTKLNRCTTYCILDKLIQKGLVSQFIENDIKYYTAKNPIRIITILEKQRSELNIQIALIKENLHRFDQIKNANIRLPHIKTIDGYAEIQRIQKDLTKETTSTRTSGGAKILTTKDKIIFLSKKREFGIIIEDTELTNLLTQLQASSFREHQAT